MLIKTKEMIQSRIELLQARPKENQKIITKLEREIRRMEKKGN